jgi:hypothetical protein
MAALMRAIRSRLAPAAHEAVPGMVRDATPSREALAKLQPRAVAGRLWWQVRRELSRLGWPGLAGLALLAAAAVLWLGAQRPDENRAGQLRADVADLRARLRSAGEAGEDGRSRPPATRAAQLATFYGFFPVVGSLPDWLAVLNTAAAKNGLVLESGDYALVQARGEQRLARYEMTLPVKGSWPQLRGFVAEVMEQIPAAALEDLALRREAVGTEQVEAKLKFVLWLGAGGARGPDAAASAPQAAVPPPATPAPAERAPTAGTEVVQ